MRYYLGLKGSHRELFKADSDPTFATHGEQYDAAIGPFRTKRGAIYMQRYGQGNPHCRTVADAERLGRK